MSNLISVPCPTCSCTGESTHGDRHAGTRMDTCQTCGGSRFIPARTGETPEASFCPMSSPMTQNAKDTGLRAATTTQRARHVTDAEMEAGVKARCTGCGCDATIAQIRARHPTALTCCPERDMRAIEPALDKAGDREGVDLWCMYVQGPDEVHAAPDFWTALAWAADHNTFVAARAAKDGWADDEDVPLTQATVARWPWSVEAHAEGLAEELSKRAAHEAKRAALSTGNEEIRQNEVILTVDLPKPTRDQQDYLRNVQLSVSDFDPNTMIRGNDPFGKSAQYPVGMQTVRAGAAPTPPVSPEPDSRAGVEREADGTEETDAERHKRIGWQMLQHGGVDSEDMEWMHDKALAAIQSAPTASAAARPVEARSIERSEIACIIKRWFRHSKQYHHGHEADDAANEIVTALYPKATTPTPAPHPGPATQTTGEVR